MKIFLQTTILVTLISAMQAQPTITRATLMQPGDVLFSSDAATPPSPGAAGAGALWDFSNVSADPEVVQQQVGRVDTTPYAADYPEANLSIFASALGFRAYEFDNLTDNFFEAHGGLVPGFAGTTYSDPKRFLQLPLTFGTNWTDDFEYTQDYIVSPVQYVGDGSLAASADGYGTLLLPQAEFSQVIRVKIIEESTDSAYLGFDTSERNYYFDTTYVWLSPEYHGPLASYSKSRQYSLYYLVTPDTIIVDSETTHGSSFSFDPMAQPPSATQNVQPGNFALQISPNPFVDAVELSFTMERPEALRLLVQDLTGRIVFEQSLNGQSGDNHIPVALPTLAPGSYIAILKSTERGDVQKLIRLTQ